MLPILKAKKIKFSPFCIKIILFFSLIYLLLPQIIFEAIAFRLGFSILFVGATLVMLALAWKYVPIVDYSVEIPVYVLIVSEVIIVVVFIISGLGGIMGIQTSDYLRSNAILSDLVKYKWPVLYNENYNLSVLNYYIAYYIPGAAFGKLVGHSFHCAEIATLVWTVIGMSLGVLLIYILTKVCKLKTLWLLLCWGGLDCVGLILVNGSLFYGTQHLEHWASIEKDYGNGHIANYMSVACDINWNPQHFIPALILVGIILIMVNSKKYKLSILLSASLLFWSPLVAIGVLPFAIVLIVYEKGKISKFFSIPDILSIFLIILPMCMYYLSMNLSSAGGRESYIRGLDWFVNNWPIVIAFFALEFGIVGYILFRSMSKDDKLSKILCITAVVFMSLSLFIDYGRCHDFSMRATVISWLVLFTFAPRLMDSNNNIYKKYLIYYMIGASITSCTEYMRMVDGVYKQGFNIVRAENENNTISGWGLQYQYVGDPDSLFFQKLCKVDYDFNLYKKRLVKDGKNYLIYENGNWDVYIYNGSIYIYNSQGSGEVKVKNIGGEIDGQETMYTKENTILYGTLSEIDGLIKIGINNISCEQMQFTFLDSDGEKVKTWTKEEICSMLAS